MGQQDDPEDLRARKNQIKEEAFKNMDNQAEEPGKSAASGIVTTEGTEEMLAEVGLTMNEASRETSLEEVNDLIYAVSDTDRAERYDAFMGRQSPSKGIKNRHEEAGVAEYAGEFQFLTEEGKTVTNALDRLEEDTELNVGEAVGSLAMEAQTEETGKKIEMYQEIKSGDYDKQKSLAESVDYDQADVSRTLSEWDELGMIDREDSIQLTDDGYEISKTLRGLESYTS